MASRKAKELIPWAVNNADGGDFIRGEDGKIELSNRYFNSDGTKAPQLKFLKLINGDTMYMSECVPDSINKRVYITSAYIKKDSTNQLLNMDSKESPQPTPKASFDSSATIKIVTQDTNSVKTNRNISTNLNNAKDEMGDVKAHYADENKRIDQNMTDSERTEILKTKILVAPFYEGQADELIALNQEKLESQKENFAKRQFWK